MKLKLLIILVLLIPVVLAFSGTKDIRGDMKIADRDIGKTMIMEDNIAAVKAIDKEVYIDKFEAKSGDTINLETTGEINNICFIFTVSTSKIKIELTEKSVFWFDNKLEPKIEDTRICYEGLGLSSDNLYYTINYNGDGRIKYDIDFDGTILDPYVVGSLNTSDYLSLYIPFNGNINAAWNSITTPLNTSSVRSKTFDATSYSGELVDASYYYDGSYGTASWVARSGCGAASNAEIFIYYNKTASDTGMVLQKKDDVVGDGTKYNQGYTNISVPADCFNFNAAQVTFKILMSTSYPDYGSLNYYCLGNGGYTNIHSTYTGDASGGCSVTSYAYLYETTAYITNQSGYVSVTQGTVPTALINNLNMTAGYVFAVNNNSNDITNIYNGTDTIIIYNSSGANFNGSSRINLSNAIQIGDAAQNYTIIARYKLAGTQPESNVGHLFGSMASGWQKGWQLQATPTNISYSCTSTSGVTGYTKSNNLDALSEHTIAIVVRNVPVVS